MHSFARWAAVLAALAAGLPAYAGALAPHVAVYALSKGVQRAGDSIVAIQGSMSLRIEEACDGWSLSQRIRMTLTDNLNQETESDSRYASYESKDGQTLAFAGSDWQDGALLDESAGAAERPAPDKPGRVVFTRPRLDVVDLPASALFPVAFNIALLDLAERGEGYHTLLGFDGGNGEGPYVIGAYIGKERASAFEGNGEAMDLVGGKVRGVRVAYFPVDSRTPDPELEFEMEMQADGVSPLMRLDYAKYQVKAKLVGIEKLPRPKCGG